MNESAARDVVAVRAYEGADDARAVWTDADRDWATRAAAEVVGADAGADAFLARRASLALERLKSRRPGLKRWLAGASWRGWLAPVVIVGALVLGVAADQLGGRRINILAPPLVALLLWNLAVYIAIALSPVLRTVAGRRIADLGPIRAFFARLFARIKSPLQGDSSVDAQAGLAFVREWTRLSAPLTGTRIARVLHLGAAAFAIGAVVGMYFRGLVFEYRAGWESTFLGAGTVQRLLAFVLAPGSLVTGIEVPDAAHLERIRFDGAAGGENAAPWIHLYAATVALVVVVPRLALALGAWLAERRLESRFPLPLEEPYFRRLSRDYAQGPAHVVVVPYSYQPAAPAIDGLKAVLARTFGPRVQVETQEPIAYGDEERAAARVPADAPADVAIALFNLAATPEAENHVAFIDALARSPGARESTIALVDESAYARRFAGQPARVEERRAAWRAALQGGRVAPVFVDLDAPNVGAAESALRAELERPREKSERR